MSVTGVTWTEARAVWWRVAMQSFGGPAAQISVMHRIVVDEKRWIGEARFLHALNGCMLLPGPEAQQLATYLGWLLHGVRGGLFAGALFVLPGFLALQALSTVYVLWHDVPWVASMFWGVQAAVLAVIVEAVDRLGKRVLKTNTLRALAVMALLAVLAGRVPFPIVVAVAALIGAVGARLAPDHFVLSGPGARGPMTEGLLDDALDRDLVPHARPDLGRALRIAAVGLALWIGPTLLLLGTRGREDLYVQLATFFSGAALVTFGGAYSVLAYVAQHAVETRHWLSADAMTHGLALAESTPGPLIQVVQFVGFVAAAGQAGSLHPVVAGTLSGALVTWVTFVPSFLWVLVGAPWFERLRHVRALSAALSGISAAVVGVVTSLGVWLAAHVLFTAQVTLRPLPGVAWTVPHPGTVDLGALAIALASAAALLRWHMPLGRVLLAAAAVGLLRDLVT